MCFVELIHYSNFVKHYSFFAKEKRVFHQRWVQWSQFVNPAVESEGIKCQRGKYRLVLNPCSWENKDVRGEFDMPNCRVLREEPGINVILKNLPPSDNFQSLRCCEEPIKGKGWKVFRTREKINWISNSQLCYFTTEKKGEFENNSKGMKIKQKLILSIKIIKLEAEMKICRKVGSSKNGRRKILINPRNSKISINIFFKFLSSLYLILFLW